VSTDDAIAEVMARLGFVTRSEVARGLHHGGD